jgi:hypothetical protein
MMVSLQDINDAVKKVKGVDEVYAHKMSEFQCGVFCRDKKNLIKMTVAFPASECVNDNVKGIPLKVGDWKLIPLLVFVKVDYQEGKE